MVELRVKENYCKAIVAGDMTSIIAELSLGIGNIYQSIKTTQGEEAADVFRIGMLIALAPDCPTWEPNPGMVVIDRKRG